MHQKTISVKFSVHWRSNVITVDNLVFDIKLHYFTYMGYEYSNVQAINYDRHSLPLANNTIPYTSRLNQAKISWVYGKQSIMRWIRNHEGCPESKDTSLLKLEGTYFLKLATLLSPSICIMRHNSLDLNRGNNMLAV